MWVRTGASGEDAGEDTAPAAGFTGRSPAFLVAVAQLLGLHAEGSSSGRLVAFIEPALAPVPVEVAWSLTTVEEYPTEVGPLPVERYETVDLASGQRATVHLAGDVVLAGTGVELDALDSHRRFRRGSRGEASRLRVRTPTRTAPSPAPFFGVATYPHRQSRATSGVCGRHGS